MRRHILRLVAKKHGPTPPHMSAVQLPIWTKSAWGNRWGNFARPFVNALICSLSRLRSIPSLAMKNYASRHARNRRWNTDTRVKIHPSPVAMAGGSVHRWPARLRLQVPHPLFFYAQQWCDAGDCRSALWVCTGLVIAFPSMSREP